MKTILPVLAPLLGGLRRLIHPTGQEDVNPHRLPVRRGARTLRFLWSIGNC